MIGTYFALAAVGFTGLLAVLAAIFVIVCIIACFKEIVAGIGVTIAAVAFCAIPMTLLYGLGSLLLHWFPALGRLAGVA